MKPFKILSKKLLLDKPFCRVEEQEVQIPNGTIKPWYVALSRDSVIVVPVLDDGSVLLQKSYKHGCRNVITEFPAGVIDDGETWEEAAPRELLEETGYTAKNFVKLGHIFPNPSGSEKRHHIVLAQGSELTEKPDREEDEQIEPFVVRSLEEAQRLLLHSETKTSSGTLAAMSFLTTVMSSSDNNEQ